MKSLLFISILFSFTACNSGDKQQKVNPAESHTQNAKTPLKDTSSIKSILSGYLEIKNALANDNGDEAAKGGRAMFDAVEHFDTSSLPVQKLKAYKDAADDLKENAEHISKNGSNISHQREHFEMLTEDVYDLVKAFGAGNKLYKDYCPMYNDNKGAIWLSETKEIKNPYLGKKMSTCGEVKEEIK